MAQLSGRVPLSVVMSVYNGERYLGLAIESVLRQTYSDFEFIIVNDGSSDRTAEILWEYARSDKRIEILTNEENKGLTSSLNFGIQHARGSVIARQDADDLSIEDRFKEQMAILETNHEIVLVSCDIEFIDEQGSLLVIHKASQFETILPQLLAIYNCIGGHGQTMFRKATWERIGGFDSSFKFA
ncbi:MAG: glycosyltransferase family 2 protein, partial [Bdellovibrionales bacterium]|nr:glycosyltransferase family 2 protein [Bdellovibrionales bacterium]